MAIKIPPELNLTEPQICAICRVKLPFVKATAGHYTIESHQAFSCVSHLSEVELLIVGWADFMVAERQGYERRKRELRGLSCAWLNS